MVYIIKIIIIVYIYIILYRYEKCNYNNMTHVLIIKTKNLI